MIIENPQRIKKADIVVGIPTYNEVANIGFVTEQISLGLEKYFSEKTCVIINADNNSADGTKEAFFEAQGQTPKVYISTQPGFKGKGYNLYNFFLIMQKMEAQAGLAFDADLKSISPEWIKKMAEPLFKDYQFIAPYYLRLENEATITNHLAYPLVYGLFGYDLRQPIGGDFAFSDKMADWWLEKKWPQAAFAFGVDIFISLHALLAGAKCAQVNLGQKIHRITQPASLGKMFSQVAETLFRLILEHQHQARERTKVKKIDILGNQEILALADLKPDYQPYKKAFFDKFEFSLDSLKGLVSQPVYQESKEIKRGEKLLINLDLWTKIVYDLLAAYQAKDQDPSIIETLKCFYFGRLASFFEETSNLTPGQAEREIVNQAQHFFDQRNYFLSK